MLEQCANKVLYEYTVDSRLLLLLWTPRSAVKLSSVDRSAVRKRLGTTELHRVIISASIVNLYGRKITFAMDDMSWIKSI